MNENFFIGVSAAVVGFAALLAVVSSGGTVAEGFVAFSFITTIASAVLFWWQRELTSTFA